MRVVILMDSFKGSLSSVQAGECVRQAFEGVFPGVDCLVSPVADGGEGTVDSLLGLPGAQKCEVLVRDPLDRPHTGYYAYLPERQLAILEMSQASGLTLVGKTLEPRRASTFGFGQMILDALDRGARHFIVGLGGSATNDGGVGMLQALGFGFLDAAGRAIAPGVAGLAELETITTSGADPRLGDCDFRIACDVDNPLLGPRGSSAVYGPQKGATPADVPIFDGWLAHYHDCTQKVFPGARQDVPGAGAAGGMGYAFLNYLNARPQSGIELVLEELGVETAISQADLVITGEGRMDFQTAMAKAPIGIAKMAKRYGKPVVAFAGVIDQRATEVNDHGIDAFFPILDSLIPLEVAMSEERALANLHRTATQVARLLQARVQIQ